MHRTTPLSSSPRIRLREPLGLLAPSKCCLCLAPSSFGWPPPGLSWGFLLSAPSAEGSWVSPPYLEAFSLGEFSCGQGWETVVVQGDSLSPTLKTYRVPTAAVPRPAPRLRHLCLQACPQAHPCPRSPPHGSPSPSPQPWAWGHALGGEVGIGVGAKDPFPGALLGTPGLRLRMQLHQGKFLD